MLSTLLFFLVFVLCVIFFVSLAFGQIIRFVLGLLGFRLPDEQAQYGGGQANTRGYSERTGGGFGSNSRQDAPNSTSETHTGRQREKIFQKNDSEYVDFEEVK